MGNYAEHKELVGDISDSVDISGCEHKGQPHSARPGKFSNEERHFMGLAVEEARSALTHDDVPIGAVVVVAGRVIGRGHNKRELLSDPTAHAEILALRMAAQALESWRILDSTLYITLEPCAMCAGAIVLARISRVIFGTADPKAGAAGSVLNVLAQPRLNHRPEVRGGCLELQSAKLLTEFFAQRRGR